MLAAALLPHAQAQFNQQGPKLVGSGNAGATQGRSTALSADGTTAIVGASNDAGGVGSAFIWTRSAGVWTPQGARLIGAGYTGSPFQGRSVALSADGNTAIVGGPIDNGGVGAVWVWTRTAGVWTQEAPNWSGRERLESHSKARP